MLPSVESRPRNSTWVLALEEERFGFAVLEAEDLAIATDVELSLCEAKSISYVPMSPSLV